MGATPARPWARHAPPVGRAWRRSVLIHPPPCLDWSAVLAADNGN